MKTANLLIHCPECGHKSDLYEVRFYGVRIPKFRVECPSCGTRTPYYEDAREAVRAWNRGTVKKKRSDEEYIDNEGLVDMMSHVMRAVNEDYQFIASKEYLTRADKVQLQWLEEFINENPYMLPYDRGYVLEEMKRQAEAAKSKKARKKHVS